MCFKGPELLFLTTFLCYSRRMQSSHPREGIGVYIWSFNSASTGISTPSTPPLHSSYEAFKQYMMEGISQAPTFGLA